MLRYHYGSNLTDIFRQPQGPCPDLSHGVRGLLWYTSRLCVSANRRRNSHRSYFTLAETCCLSSLAPTSNKVQYASFMIPLKKLAGPFLVRASEIMISPATHRSCPLVCCKSFFRIVKSMAVLLSSTCDAMLVDLLRLSNSERESVTAMKGSFRSAVANWIGSFEGL